jgi:hypothetical protein
MSTWKEKYNKKHGFAADAAHSLEDIAKTTGIKKSILQQVYNRGTGAWKSNIASVRLKSGRKDAGAPRSAKMGKEQWSMARLYSFVGGGTTQKTADKDLWTKHLMEEHKAHHTPKHMTLMRKLIKEGKSFAQAHRQALKEVGK